MSGFRKQIDPEVYFSSIEIPETWPDVASFTDWYFDVRMPLMIPANASVTRTDDATAICIFKKPPYQIEMYIIHPKMMIPTHAHPDVEIVTAILGGGKIWRSTNVGTSASWGIVSQILKSGEYHGGPHLSALSEGYVLLSFEKWPDNAEITSAAIQWKGPTAGPIHDELIRKRSPCSYKREGYADISRPADDSI